MFEEFGLMSDFNEARKCGANLLAQKADGSCVYLEDNECSIHAGRPKVCRDFFCTSKAIKFSGMVKIIKNNDKQKISSVLQIKG
jgi:Fe-S-cluster containining protein